MPLSLRDIPLIRQGAIAKRIAPHVVTLRRNAFHLLRPTRVIAMVARVIQTAAGLPAETARDPRGHRSD